VDGIFRLRVLMGLELMSYKLNLPHNNDPIFCALLLVYGSALEMILLFFPLRLFSHFV